MTYRIFALPTRQSDKRLFTMNKRMVCLPGFSRKYTSRLTEDDLNGPMTDLNTTQRALMPFINKLLGDQDIVRIKIRQCELEVTIDPEFDWNVIEKIVKDALCEAFFPGEDVEFESH